MKSFLGKPNTTRRPVYADRVVQRRHRPDYMLVVIVSTLLAIGLIVVYAISPALRIQKNVGENYFVLKQLSAIMLGIMAFGIVASIPFRVWQHSQKILIMLASLATIVALILPISSEYPAHRWIRFGGLSLQSVELIKLAVLICLAAFLAQRVKDGSVSDGKKSLRPILIFTGLISLVVGVAQKDLGSLGVLVAIIAFMSFVAGLSMKRVLIGAVLLIVVGFLLVVPFSYRRDRVLTFLHPEQDCQDIGYQACQALIAVGSGGLLGKGLSKGAQANGYLPEASNDSIFAIIGEKGGFLGAGVLVVLFGCLFGRIKNILERAPDDFSRLVVSGVLAWLSTQTIINIGAMIGLLPLKGITLPLISYGGTSIIFVLAALGLVFQVSRFTTFGINTDIGGAGHESAIDWRRNRRSHYANPGRRA